MENYRKSSHTVYDIKFHIVWITKYRKPILRADIAQRVRDLIREICRANDVEIIKGHVSRDHVHIFVSIPPHLSVGQLVKSIKGKTSRKMLTQTVPQSDLRQSDIFRGSCSDQIHRTP